MDTTSATPDDQSPSDSKPKKLDFTLREITEDELDKVCWVVSKAFLDDRVGNFMWNFEKVSDYI
jgi:hypothetical protein